MTQQPTGRRTGSSMSDKQIGRAAVQGRQITFRFLPGPAVHEVRGYVVGMDDYKWLVASINPTLAADLTVPRLRVATALVHKSVDLCLFGEPDLEYAPDYVRAEVTSIGQSFWDWCNRTYNGLTGH